MTKEEYLVQIKNDPRKKLIFETIMKCTEYHELYDFMSAWEHTISQLEYIAYHKGIKEAERVLRAGKGQPNIK